MKFNKIFLLGMFALLSCSQREHYQFNSHKSEKWSNDQSVACDAMNINGLLGLNGKDVYYFPRCLAGTNEDGELKHFQSTNSLMETLGVDAIDKAMELVRMNPAQEAGLPLMSSLLVMLERGTVVDGKSNKALQDKMFGPFQDFLMGMDPYWMSHLALQMAQSGELENILDDFGLLVEAIDMGPVFGNLNASLNDKEVKDSLVYATTRVLDTPALYNSFRELVTFEKSHSVISEMQSKYLSDWLDPQINDFEQIPIDQKNLQAEAETGVERYNRFVAGLSDDEVAKIAKLSSVLFEKFAKMDAEERLGIIKKLFDGFSEAYTEQAAPVRNLMALVDYLTNQAKTIDLQYVIKGISELLEGTGPAAILSLNHKVGSAKLHALADKKLYEGGRVPGCDLVLNGVNKGSVDNYAGILDAINLFVRPNSSCMYGLSPLASLVYGEIQNSLGIEADCDGELCFSSNELNKVATSLNSFQWDDLNRGVSADPQVIKELLVDALSEQVVLLNEDSYALYWDHLSIGAVSSSVLEEIIALVQKQKSVDAKVISELDHLLETSDQFRTYFHPYFLESLLNNKISNLAAVSEQFGNIFAANDKADRLFSGVYLGGPLYQLLISELSLPELQGEMELPRVHFRAKELLSRLKRPGNIFKNGRLDYYEDGIPQKYLGERTRSVEFAYEKMTDPDSGAKYYQYTGMEFSKDPTALEDLFSDDYWRFDSLLLNDHLLSKDITDGQNDQFTRWVQYELYPYLTSKIDWVSKAQKFKSVKSVDTRYYNIKPYSQDELRRIALFYSQNFMAAPALLPNDEQTFEMERRRSKRTPNVSSVFVGLPYDSVGKWGAFNVNFPAGLSSQVNFDSYLGSITKEQLDSIDWRSMPAEKNGQYQLQGYNDADAEVIKLLSALNLLTVNRSKEYMPLVALGEYCYYRGKGEKCPLTFVDKEGRSAIQSYRSYVGRVAKSYTCSVVSTDDSSFNEYMGAALGISINALDCSQVKNLFEQQESALPSWLHRQILKDIFVMGKRAQLKPGLTTLAAQIRYHRLVQKYPKDLFQVMRGLTNTWSYLPAEMTAYAHKQMADHKGFLVYRPGFINVYTNYLVKSIASGGYSEDLLSYYGAGVRVGQDLSAGIGQTLLTDVLIGTYNEIQDKNVSVLDYLFKVIQKLARPQYKEHLKAIANVVSYPQDLEALSTYTLTIPLLIKHLATFDLPQTFWQRPGNSIIRHIILHQEKMRSLNDLLFNFDFEDVHSALKTLVETFYIMGTSEEINILAKKVVAFLRDEMIACNNDGVGIIKIIEQNLRKIMLEDAVDQDFRSINNLIHLMGKETVGFDGKKVAPVIGQIEQIISFGVKNLPNILWRYQNHMSKSSEDDNYFYKLMHSLIDPLRGMLGDLGAKALAAVLSSSDMADWDGLVKPLLFDKRYQKTLIEVMKASDKASLDEYQRAVEETNRILPMASLYLNYVVDHAKWNSDSSQYTLESLLRLSGQSSFVLDNQVVLFNKWFAKAKMNK